MSRVIVGLHLEKFKMSLPRPSDHSRSRVIYQSPGSIAGMTKNFVPLPESSEFPRRLYSAQPFNPTRTQPIRYMALAGPIDPNIDYIFAPPPVDAELPSGPPEVTWPYAGPPGPVYRIERNEHPAHHSRFGYPWCPNGYCTANHPGRYNTAPGLMWMDNAQPPDMAPSRFYSGKWQDPNYNSSDAYNDSFIARRFR